MVAQVKTNAAPRVELLTVRQVVKLGELTYVILHGDRAADTLLSTNGPVLLESASTVDGRLVGAGRDIEVVGTAVSVDTALVLGPVARVVGAIRFDDIVLDERVAGPAVDGEVPVATGVEGTAVVDGTKESE